MTKSKGWNWSIVKGNHADFWRTPSMESFYLVNRWQSLGFRDFLDLGCGLGRHAILFGKSDFTVSCFDISEEAIKQTKAWAESESLVFDYRVGDMLELPYSDGSFNAVLCRNVISHTDTAGMKKIVSELLRILRPGGECYLTLGSKDTWGWKEANWPLILNFAEKMDQRTASHISTLTMTSSRNYSANLRFFNFTKSRSSTRTKRRRKFTNLGITTF